MTRAIRLVALIVAGTLALLMGVVLRGPAPSGGVPAATASTPAGTSAATASGAPSAPVDLAAYLYPQARPAPGLALLDPDARPFSLSGLRGQLALVFFGYTHCPDVCPATIGTVGEAMRAYGGGVQAVFVTVDPERDTTAWLQQYRQYLPAGFTPLTGTADEIRATADAWGVRYARVDTGTPGEYSMSHTADVYLVDQDGELRGHFPFGTDSATMVAVLHAVAAAPLASPSITPSGPPATAAPTQPSGATALEVEVVSSSIWAGTSTPVILALSGPAGRLADPTLRPTVQLTTADGAPVGDPVSATPVQPPGVAAVSYVASLSVPSPGSWRLAVTAQSGALPLNGTSSLFTARDPGATPAIGGAAPQVHTPTVGDVGGDLRQVTTDPIADPRLSQRSTTDALADHVPFVLVLDSTRFRVTSACGRAVILAKYLLDRWPDITFIHHEPYRYSIVTDTPVLEGSLADPVLTDVATAWGLGTPPWDAASMPWIFIVDGNGTVRAKYQGVVGSDDVDVILAWLAQGG